MCYLQGLNATWGEQCKPQEMKIEVGVVDGPSERVLLLANRRSMGIDMQTWISPIYLCSIPRDAEESSFS